MGGLGETSGPSYVSLPDQEEVVLQAGDVELHEQPESRDQVEPRDSKSKSGLRSCSWILLLAVSGAVLGGAFQFGFAIANVANTLPIIASTFNASSLYLSVLVSGNPIGGLVGALVAGFLADRLGRTKTMMLNVFPMVVGCVVMATGVSMFQLLLGRIIIGFAVGIGSGLTPMFLSEVAPIAVRGAFGMLYGVMVTVGILCSYLLSLPQIMGEGNVGWRVFFAFPILPALYQTMALYFCPESPNFLVFNKKDSVAARAALLRYRVGDTTEELATLEKTGASSTRPLSLRELFTDPGHRLALLIGIGLHCSQQLSAINAVLSYTPQIFEEAKVGSPELATLATGTVNVLATFVAAPLIDKLGRRFIMWLGLLLMSVAYGGLAVTQSCNKVASWGCAGGWTEVVAIGTVFLFIIGFASGAGSIPWLMVGEIFPIEARGKASSICVGVNWGCSLLVLISYDSINSALQPYTFFLYMTVVLFFLLFTVLFVPETRLKTVEQINREIRGQAAKCPPFVF